MSHLASSLRFNAFIDLSVNISPKESGDIDQHKTMSIRFLM